jgi:methyl-accepting chemotaxis protein
MTLQKPIDTSNHVNKLARAASKLGFEIVDIDGFLSLVETHAVQQRDALAALLCNIEELAGANSDAANLAQQLRATSERARSDIATSAELVRTFSEKSKSMAVWVTSVRDRSETVRETLTAVKANNAQIASIATQVNTLAINSKIEAARAGDAGRGFAVVADAINDLSHKTSSAACHISDNVEELSDWITDLGREAIDVAEAAHSALDASVETDAALTRMENTIELEHRQTQSISVQTQRAKKAMDVLQPRIQEIDTTVRETTSGVTRMHKRMANLISGSELIVQLCADIGGATPDAPFIAAVQTTAAEISKGLEEAVLQNKITMTHLFDRQYVPVRHTNPTQFTTKAVQFLDRFLPEFQEPALGLDTKVVFCAAVDTNGFLPTHNKMFSQTQGSDVVWNTANCRNRRIFDDRVGLKSGNSTAPFLLQVYRRDMGGGAFCVMKDLSAPIWVNGKHWGGLRLAYSM